MDEVKHKENYFKIFQKYLKKNYKFIIFLIVLFLSFILVTQFYFYYKNNQVLNSSIQYNLINSNNSKTDLIDIIDQLSNEKNFYGTLATLEKIKIKISEGDIISAKENYLNLLNESKLNKLYKSAIATHASYNFLNIIDRNNEKNIIILINNFLTHIDTNISSYVGFKLEILYLLSVIKQDMNNDFSINDETQNLYKEIQENDKISSSLKERVNKINEYQKYK